MKTMYKYIVVNSEEEAIKASQYFKSLGATYTDNDLDEPYSNSTTAVAWDMSDNFFWHSQLELERFEEDEQIFLEDI